jgi:class 3 adenylate cyclase
MRTTATTPHTAPSVAPTCKEAPRDETILFADLCGFTEFTWRNGDDVAAKLATEFHEHARRLGAQEGCSFVKALGDGVMMHGTDCFAVVRIAHQMLAFGTPEHRLSVRIGLDRGPAVERGGDWYGSTVNAAARVAGFAAPGELLITERARAALSIMGAMTLVPRGVCPLKGLPAQHLHAVLAV